MVVSPWGMAMGLTGGGIRTYGVESMERSGYWQSERCGEAWYAGFSRYGGEIPFEVLRRRAQRHLFGASASPQDFPNRTPFSA